MPSTPKNRPRTAAPRPAPATRVSAFEKALNDMRNQPPSAYPHVSLRWLMGAAGVVLLGAVTLAWMALCLLYWQGSWQLLYHPKAAISRTPDSVGIPFQKVSFAATETGKTQLTGWWIPAGLSLDPPTRFTVLYLHGADGNLSDSVDSLAALHGQGLPIFAVDYRGYGQSEALLSRGRPNEKQLRQDAEWSLTWLTVTRQIPPAHILVIGSGLGANLAAELAADHNELAGVILDQPQQTPMNPVFQDSRSRLVPAHWLVTDRYDLNGPAARLQIPSLWLMSEPAGRGRAEAPDAFEATHARKSVVWLTSPAFADAQFAGTLRRWLDDL
jgi:pimeloyl-ACP methyl ester carboxylesterase